MWNLKFPEIKTAKSSLVISEIQLEGTNLIYWRRSNAQFRKKKSFQKQKSHEMNPGTFSRLNHNFGKKNFLELFEWKNRVRYFIETAEVLYSWVKLNFFSSWFHLKPSKCSNSATFRFITLRRYHYKQDSALETSFHNFRQQNTFWGNSFNHCGRVMEFESTCSIKSPKKFHVYISQSIIISWFYHLVSKWFLNIL